MVETEQNAKLLSWRCFYNLRSTQKIRIMTFSFTLGKRFFKVAHYFSKVLIIAVLFFTHVIPLFKKLNAFLEKTRYIGWDFFPDSFKWSDVPNLIVGLIGWVLVITALINLKYVSKNTYDSNSRSPKDDMEYWEVFPVLMLRGFLLTLMVAPILSLFEVFDSGDWEHYLSGFLVSSLMGLFLTLLIVPILAKRNYRKVFDKIWSDESGEVTLIIEHKQLLNGSAPDGLTHLKEGDRVKLIPSDVPGDENVINVVNETPNGPVLMDTILSRYLKKRLEVNGIGFMYGTIFSFESSNHIRLELHHGDIGPLTIFSRERLDELFPKAALLVVQTQQGSTSMIQRKLELGYNRAGRIVDQLEAQGILGPFQGTKPREVLIASEEELKRKLDEIMDEWDVLRARLRRRK